MKRYWTWSVILNAFCEITVNSQELCFRHSCGNLKEQYLRGAHMKSLVLSWRPAGMSDAKGPIWDSVSQHWRNNCKGLEKCLYKESTMLVHLKVKEKLKLYQCSMYFFMYFFYRHLAYHCGWLFLITANASEGCAVGDGMWLAQSQGTAAFIRATRRQTICKMHLFFSLVVFSK